MNLAQIKKIHITQNIDEVNELLKDNWVLLDFMHGGKCGIKFILGYAKNLVETADSVESN